MGNILKLALTFKGLAADIFRPSKVVTAVVIAGLLSSCSASKWHESKGETNIGDAAPLQTTPAPFRTTTLPAEPSVPTGPAVPAHAKVPVAHKEPPKPASPAKFKKVAKIPPRAAQAEKQSVTSISGNTDPSKYFVIQNVATEKLRVYLNCPSKSSNGACVHKMLFETDMAAGRDTQQGRSILGSFMISRWFKFYEDEEHQFPSFIAPGYPTLPSTGARLSSWLSRANLPDGDGQIRGSFGWYTAKLEPNADQQWTHGTLGWGNDQGRFIKEAKKISNARTFPRSEGCTRVENRVIALMREILPPGTRMFKVYAREATADSSVARSQGGEIARWSWVLTKNGTMSTSAKSGVSENMLARPQDILDKGTYTLDQTPKAFEGNLYRIPRSSFTGVLLVDEGRLAGYAHPTELGVGGFKSHSLPSFIVSKRTL